MRRNWIYLSISILCVIGLLVGCTTPAPTATAVAKASASPTSAPPSPTAAAKASPTPQPTFTPRSPDAKRLVLATTTSTQDAGLLPVILPDFEQQYSVKVDVIAVGSGQALKLGQDGNADVLLVHSRAQENAFMAAGDGVRREDVMYNDFIIVGPESDPAGIKGLTSATDAFKKIADKKATFISRGDGSGTDTKEKAIWKAASIEPAGDWYVSAGQGMGEVLTMAQEKEAYTLSDRATYLTRTQSGLKLQILVQGDKTLFNPYGVIAVNPNKGPQINADMASKFIDWLISLPTQDKIAQFGMDKFGVSLFTPDSTAWRAAHPKPEQPQDGVPASAALKINGKVKTEMGWTEEQIKAMETIQVQSKNKQGETSTYTGVLMSKLLALAGPQSDATTLVMIGGDGYTAEAALADVQACTNCIISFRDQGGFSTVLPDMPGNVQVKGVVELQVK